jgi:hypothetical protein
METFEMLKVAFRKQTMGITQVLEQFSQVKSSVTSNDLEHPSTSQTDENMG